jgi:hyperosmotically inducible protein
VVVDETRSEARTAIDATKKAGNAAIDASKDAARATADKTKEIAGDVVEKSKDIAVATGATVTDGWTTTKVKAKFADDTVLTHSNISVETTNHVVTLTGTVPSSTARSHAAAIAAGTEGVRRVANQLVVKND